MCFSFGVNLIKRLEVSSVDFLLMFCIFTMVHAGLVMG